MRTFSKPLKYVHPKPSILRRKMALKLIQILVPFVNSSQIYSNVDDLNQGQDGAACDRKGTGLLGDGKAKRLNWVEI